MLDSPGAQDPRSWARVDAGLGHWIGLLLSLVGVVAIIVLGLAGHLGWYINPRYIPFTMVSAVFGGAVVVAAIIAGPLRLAGHDPDVVAASPRPPTFQLAQQPWFPPPVPQRIGLPIAPIPDPASAAPPVGAEFIMPPTVRMVTPPTRGHPRHDHLPDDHDRSAERGPSQPRAAGRTAGRLLVLVAAVAVLLVIPPSTLTMSLTQHRELLDAAQLPTSERDPGLVSGDPATYTVKDWSLALLQRGPEAVVGQNVNVNGYVLDRGDDDVFYVSRLFIICCAADARPIGIAVYQPDWRTTKKVGQWVQLAGEFRTDIRTEADYPAVVAPTSVKLIDEPNDPYVY